MALTATILDNSAARSKQRVRWRCLDETTGELFGPFVDFRPTGEDASAWVSAQATLLETALRDAEILKNFGVLLNGGSSFTFARSTAAQNRMYLRQVHQDATGWYAVVIGRGIFIQNWTDTQLKNTFNVNDAQLPALKTRLSNQASKYDAALAEVGQ